MAKILTVALDAKQVRQACEAYVATLMDDSDQKRTDYTATLHHFDEGLAGRPVATVEITKKHAPRKPKQKIRAVA